MNIINKALYFVELNNDFTIKREISKIDSEKLVMAASLIKLIYSLSFFDRYMERPDGLNFLNKSIVITKSDLAGYGTDVLSDLLGDSSSISLSPMILVGLMLKYSCNSSTKILCTRYFTDRENLQDEISSKWNLKGIFLSGINNVSNNLVSLNDIYKVYREIYSRDGQVWDFVRERLKTSRNIYYFFDQLGVEILGSKSGTLHENDYYWINDSGIFRLKGKTFFIALSIKKRRIQDAVLEIRQIANDLLSKI